MRRSKPGILLVLSDQHNSRFLGCGADRHQRTDTLDRLASEGALFENAYCASPLCVPSRMSFLTGRHCHELGVWQNDDSLSSDVPTFAHGLGLAGYRTVLCGRMHFIGGDQQHGFQERAVGDICSPHVGVNRAEDRFRGYFGVGDALGSAGAGRSADLEYDAAVTAAACRIIRDHEVSGDPRPLCLVVGYYSPHDPYRAYERIYRLYEGTGDEAIDPLGERSGPFAAGKRKALAIGAIPMRQILKAREAYRAKIHFLDEQLSVLMQCYDESPLSKDALTIYTSDHGEMAGEHGCWTKSVFYDGAARVPLLVRWRGTIRAGLCLAPPVSLLDVGATLLDVAGAPPLPGQRGISLLPTLTGADGPFPEAVFSELGEIGRGGPGRMVRRGEWKLNLYREHPPELFNLKDDPDEMENRAADEGCAGVLNELKNLATSDGWDAGHVRATMTARTADRVYLAEWGRATQPRHPEMWGLPAQY